MAINKKTMYGQQSVSPVARLIFGDVYNTTQVKNKGDYKYRVTAVVKPSGDLFENLKTQVDKLIQQNFPGEDPSELHLPIKPCSAMKAFKTRPEYEGLYVINASANDEHPPKIVGVDGLAHAEPGLIYCGCYCRFSLNPYAFDNMTKGISFGLQGISFIKAGKRIGAGIDPVEQFASVQVSPEELAWGVEGAEDDGFVDGEPNI